MSGAWVQTYSGVAFDVENIRPESIRIEDIAHALANQCRYNGHTTRFYSVAEHSVLVARNCRTDRLAGLLHDAAEAYLSDIPAPIKPLIPAFGELEDRILAAVYDRFGLPPGIPAEVKRVDRAILTDERAALMRPCERDWGEMMPALGIDGWTLGVCPEIAEMEFLAAFREISGET